MVTGINAESQCSYLKSPIIELLVGQGEEQTLLTAHQALLVKSPFFAEAVAQFSDAATVNRPVYKFARKLIKPTRQDE